MITLTRPLCFFDLETTGLDTMKDKIVSIAIKKIFPDGTEENFYTLVNPGVPIPEQTSLIHGIYDKDVKESSLFVALSDQIFNFIKDSDLAGFNSNIFDIPFLSMEFYRVGIIWPKPNTKFIDVGNLYKIFNPRNLSAAYKQYTGSDMEGAHNSAADVDATLQIFKGMQRSKHLPMNATVESLDLISAYDKKRVDICGKFVKDDKGNYVYNFGKHMGQRISMNNVEYLGWIQKNDFHPDTKMWAKEIYNSIIDWQQDLPF